MRICYVHEEYPEETNFGGIATYQKNVAEELAKQGNKVYVIARSLTKDKKYVENGVVIYRVYIKKIGDPIYEYREYRKKVANILRQLQDLNLIDIIEVPDWGAETVFFERYRRVPLVVRCHTPLKVWLEYNNNDFGIVKSTMLRWEKKMINSADYITCCSNALKKIMLNYFNLKDEDILVTPNPANIKKFYRDETIKKNNKLLYVGSLEERKGLVVLAKALNIVFAKYPDLTIDFIGKDTTRNHFNKSMIEVIKQIVDEKYINNLNFIGQLKNEELNYYFNSSLVGIFPSLFDNFPYVVLESMSSGLHVVGSSNSGMVEMLKDESSIYKTGDYNDLANKIIKKYELSKKENINKENMRRVFEEYNPTKVCSELLSIYRKVIDKYYLDKISYDDLKYILKDIESAKVLSFSREKGGVANLVFKVKTQANIYIVKKYLYKYDFELSKKLYEIYDKNNILSIKPINKNIIYCNGFYYNVFNYKKKEPINSIPIEYLNKLICIDKVMKNNNYKSDIINKVENYYECLKNLPEKSFKLDKKEINYVLNIYKQIRNKSFIKDKCIVHGDISKGNIINSNNNLYLIDFDETTYAFVLYEFAVIVIKMFTNSGSIDWDKFNKLKENVSIVYKKYNTKDYEDSIRYYICKILLEKFYLHEIGKIDLFSPRQKKDDYKKYLNILNSMEVCNFEK